MKGLLSTLIATAVLSWIPVRAETPDSLSTGGTIPPAGVVDGPVFPLSPLRLDPLLSGAAYSTPEQQLRMPDLRKELSTLSPTTPGTATIAGWSDGAFYATGGRTHYTGLMGVEHGALNLTHKFGRFTVNADVNATKYGYFRGLQTAYGFGGSVTYDINEKVSVSVFGSYQTGIHAISPAMAGYVSTTAFGGYVDYNADEKWGVRVGAQTYRETDNGPYRTQPIVMPYFRLNKRDVIGIDVGAILYNVLYNNSGNRIFGGHPGNPTMAPPINTSVSIPPRR